MHLQTEIPNTLAGRVRLLRDGLRLSQERLAAKAGVSTAMIRRIELEGAIPRADRLAAIAVALETTLDALLSGDAPKAERAS